jgi:hypothetical protein
MIRKGIENTLDVLGIGTTKICEDWVYKNITAYVPFRVQSRPYDSPRILVIDGNIVFEKFDNKDYSKDSFVFEKGTGHITVLSELDVEEIYYRIKNFYKHIFSECIGKVILEQEDIIWGKINADGFADHSWLFYLTTQFNKDPHRPKHRNYIKLLPNVIEDSFSYIQNLPDEYSPDINLIELVNEITNGKLRYCKYAKDDYWVEMCQYANTLGSQIKINHL